MIDETAYLLEDLNNEQKQIVLNEKNLYVTACPGSGKTRVLTRKIAFQVLKYANSCRKIVALTYTNRAANEIKERLSVLGIDSENVWIGTIHQFCLEFIIYPYKMNLKCISKGFTIIDDYTVREYLKIIHDDLNLKLKTYELNRINLTLTTDFKIIEKEHRNVVKAYHKMLFDNKEIDFDLILLLAYKILSVNNVVANNIAKIIRAIYVDEFQDTRDLQYQIIGFLTQKNSGIQTLFVGDTDQAIYTSLEGVAKTVEEIQLITNQKFVVETLYGCYRSTQRLVNFYSSFQNEHYKIESRGVNKNTSGIIKYDFEIDKQDLPEKIRQIIQQRLDEDVPEEEICIVAPQQYSLIYLSEYLKRALPDCSFDAINISPIKVNDHSVFFKLAILYFTESGVRVKRRKIVASEILKIFINEFNVDIDETYVAFDLLKLINSAKKTYKGDDGIELFQFVTEQIFSAFNISESLYPAIYKQYNLFIEETNYRIVGNSLSKNLDVFYRMFKQNKGITITTAHKVKGEEYDTVIAINLLKGKIPHWDEIINNPDKGSASAKKLLYVICSRAKNSLYLFSERGYVTGTGKPYAPTELLENIVFTYDQ